MDFGFEDLQRIQNEEDFKKLALELYQFQIKENKVYARFVKELNRSQPTELTEIPFLPISFFKTHEIRTRERSETIFLSSGTGTTGRSKHFVYSLDLYKKVFTSIFEDFAGSVKDYVILALLPNYVEQGQSSLVYMVDDLIQQSDDELSGFVLNKTQDIEIRRDLANRKGKKLIIFGVSYALLDLAERKIDLSDSLIVETGGMKGKRKEMSKEMLHEKLNTGFGTSFISSEYGMAELMSQAYSDKNGLFKQGRWFKTLIRDVNDPFRYVPDGKTGGINVIDLANMYSCPFISTQDLGKIEGEYFQLSGRFDNSDIRGCNLLLS